MHEKSIDIINTEKIQKLNTYVNAVHYGGVFCSNFKDRTPKSTPQVLITTKLINYFKEKRQAYAYALLCDQLAHLCTYGEELIGFLSISQN